MATSKSIGIFWDYENVQVWVEGAHVPLVERILEILKPKGYFKVLNVYGKWSPNDLVLKGLYTLGFKPISVPMTHKNSADIKLAVDCIASCYEASIDIVVIISADKDFIPVINHLKSIGKDVIIIANRTNSSEYITISPDDYIALESLLLTGEKQKQEKAVKNYIRRISTAFHKKPQAEDLQNQDNSKFEKKEKLPIHKDQTTQILKYSEFSEVLFSILEEFTIKRIDITLSKLHMELQQRTQDRFFTYLSVIPPNNASFNNFTSLIQHSLKGQSDFKLLNRQVIPKGGDINDSPLIAEWERFLLKIQNYLTKNPIQNGLLSRISLIHHIQSEDRGQFENEPTKSEINDKLELLLNSGLLIEDQDLNFQIAPAFTTKKEVFLKSFLVPKKQTSLLESFQ